MKKCYLPLVAMVGLLSLTSCGGGGGRGEEDGNAVYVCVYDGGYGSEWINKVAEDYKKLTGVEVKATVDSNILNRIESQLKGNPEYDIYMSHDINWQNFATRGLLANLDDLYSSKVYNSEKTFEQRAIPAGAKASKFMGRGDTEEHYYKACYTQGAGGLIYNIDMFNEHGWKVPTTYDELVALCKKINDDAVPVANSRETVKPFAWSGSDREYYWDYIVFEWWAQLAGIEKLETIKQYKGPEGKYSNGYEMYNPDTYYKELKQAYTMWRDLVATNQNNSVPQSYEASLLSAQSAFANGKAAMIPYAQWAQYELEHAMDGKLSFDYAMMKTPKAKADAQDMNYLVGFGDSMIIPEKAYNKEGAKDFLRYLASAEACKTFTESTGGSFLAFDYSDVDLTELEKTNTYMKSVHEKLTQTTQFNLASDNPITYFNASTVTPWLNNKIPYALAASDNDKNTPDALFSEMYKAAKDGWGNWLASAGLSD